MESESDDEDKTPIFYLSEDDDDEEELFEDCPCEIESGGSNSEANLEAFNCAINLQYNIHQIDGLLKNLTSLNQQDIKGNTILHFACRRRPGSFEIVKTLLSAGCDINIKNNHGNTPLLELNPFDISIVKLLIKQGADVSIQNKNGENILLLAVYECCFELVSFLIKEFGGDLTVKYNNQSLLSHAISHYYSGNNTNKINSLLQLIELLISGGCYIDESDSDGETALSCACSNSDKDVVALLLKHGANPNIMNKLGNVPLRSAIMNNEVKIVELLLMHSANPNVLVKITDPILVEAVKKGTFQIVKLLLEHGCLVNKVTKSSDGYTGCSNSALHEACDGNHIELVRLLVLYNCNLNQMNVLGDTPLHIACHRGFKHIVKLLIDSGSDINIRNSKGWTVLHIAQYGGHQDIMKIIKTKISALCQEMIDANSELLNS